jgi:hypothetical protein
MQSCSFLPLRLFQLMMHHEYVDWWERVVTLTKASNICEVPDELQLLVLNPRHTLEAPFHLCSGRSLKVGLLPISNPVTWRDWCCFERYYHTHLSKFKYRSMRPTRLTRPICFCVCAILWITVVRSYLPLATRFTESWMLKCCSIKMGVFQFGHCSQRFSFFTTQGRFHWNESSNF